MIKNKKMNLRICFMSRWTRSMLRTNSINRTSSSICLTEVQAITAKAQVVEVAATVVNKSTKKTTKTKITKRRKIIKNKTKIHQKWSLCNWRKNRFILQINESPSGQLSNVDLFIFKPKNKIRPYKRFLIWFIVRIYHWLLTKLSMKILKSWLIYGEENHSLPIVQYVNSRISFYLLLNKYWK